MADIMRTPYSRVFLIEDAAGPANEPLYMGLARAMGFDWPQGDITPIRIPDPDQYGAFVIVDEVLGERGLPSLPIQARYPSTDLSDLLRLVRERCPLDVQIHIGACQDPRDFNLGWNKILVLERARPTGYSTGELGALDAGEDAVVNEDLPLTGRDAYELKRMLMAEIGEAEVLQVVVAVALCDARTCGDCGVPSDGCQKIFAITVSQGASPGLPAELIYSSDQGVTLGETIVTTLGANEDPTDMACVGTRLVVISNVDDALHYAPIVDILNGEEAWTRMPTGFLAAGSPNAIFSLGSTLTWFVGDGGYVYFSTDVTALVVVQDAGVAAGDEILNDIHGYDENNLVAVGENNTVIYTRNGGTTWAAAPDAPAGDADDLNCVWMHTKDEWIVGDNTGRLWYTRDAGVNWTEKAFPGSGDGTVNAIWFATPTVGYMVHNTSAPLGRILRTIDGGFSWYVLPEDPIAFPVNEGLNDVVACGDDPNFVFAGGIDTVADADGFLVKGA